MHKGSEGPLKGALSAQKAFQGFETETKELLVWTNESKILPNQQSRTCYSDKSKIFFIKSKLRKLSWWPYLLKSSSKPLSSLRWFLLDLSPPPLPPLAPPRGLPRPMMTDKVWVSSNLLPGLATNSIFVCFLFLYKIIDLPRGANQWPLVEKHFSLSFLPAVPCLHHGPLKGFFELTQRPSRALNSPRPLLPELQRCKDTVRCAVLVADVPGHQHEQLTQTLTVHL